ncbi:universal stress protein [Roseateles violae]|uniref:Universal stress protein n=1 Tax=Roseateles violae TaxID=3058042 RepID=A0ABT8DZD2_9BURK|nr:universal stress protein [Pelomonas sp. PFR6]MDN3922957.1 universal stress protein [Pelomonas sp. PFR6]
MYQHLLVPIDAGDLAIDLVGYAIALARPMGARLSIVHVLDEAQAEPTAAARAEALLAMADAAARAAGVPCRGECIAGEQADALIVESAQRLGCDLIVIASHGGRARPGAALGAVTAEVLRHAGVPVLVAAGARLQARERAIEVIREEHRGLAAVLQAWRERLRQALAGGLAPSAAAMRAALDYLRAFDGDLHHGKESEQLFRLLRQRTSTLNAELDELDHRHRRDQQLLQQVGRQLERLERLGPAQRPDGLRALLRGLEQYIDYVWDHLGREEGVVLPQAQRHLLAEDWRELEASFAAAGGDAAASAQAVLAGLQA